MEKPEMTGEEAEEIEYLCTGLHDLCSFIKEYNPATDDVCEDFLDVIQSDLEDMAEKVGNIHNAVLGRHSEYYDAKLKKELGIARGGTDGDSN